MSRKRFRHQGHIVRPLVGCHTVLKNGLSGCLKRGESASQPGPHHASEHISGSGCGQTGVARRVDDGHFSGSGDDRARAFEHDGAVEALRQLLGRRQSVALDLEDRAAEQASCFQRVRCKHRGGLTFSAGTQKGLEWDTFCY